MFVRWTILIEKYRSITNYVGTAIVAWILAAIVGQVINLALPTPSSSQAAVATKRPDSFLTSRSRKRSLDYYKVICERNIFDSQKRASCEETPVEVDCEVDPLHPSCAPNEPASNTPVKSDIAATLLGTAVMYPPSKSFATISPKGKSDSETYRIGDRILDEARIYKIERNRVFFKRNGRNEYLEVDNLPQIYTKNASNNLSNDGIKRDGDKTIVSRAKVDSTLSDLNKVIQQARMVPNFKNGQVQGFKIFAIRPRSIFKQLGLRNGDIIHRINGAEINSVEKAIPMLQLARSADEIQLDITRRGKKQTMTIEIQ